MNEGTLDRTLRIAGGLVVAGAVWAGVASGIAQTVLGVVAALLLITGIAGWCPAYLLMGLSTRRTAAAAHCPACEPEHQR